MALLRKKEKPRKQISLKKIKSSLPRTVQQCIPFKDMRKDGICMVDDGYYTKTIQFADINYELADEEEQETVVKICNTCTHDYPKDGSCGCGGGYGNYVDILTDDGQYYITYGHMTDIYVSVGDTIKNGQVIGTAGCTGWSTGNHLHLEMRLGSEQGELIDPQTFIRGYVPIEETQEENQ